MQSIEDRPPGQPRRECPHDKADAGSTVSGYRGMLRPPPPLDPAADAGALEEGEIDGIFWAALIAVTELPPSAASEAPRDSPRIAATLGSARTAASAARPVAIPTPIPTASATNCAPWLQGSK